MNADDPKFTAYALDELEPAERAAIEAELRAQPALAAELEEFRQFTAQLRGELHAEEGAPLSPEQRAAVLGRAPRIVAGPRAWWRRPWLQSAAAACVIVGLIAVYFGRLEVKKPAVALRGLQEHSVKLALEQGVVAPPPGHDGEDNTSGTVADAKLAVVPPDASNHLDIGLGAKPDAAFRYFAATDPAGPQIVTGGFVGDPNAPAIQGGQGLAEGTGRLEVLAKNQGAINANVGSLSAAASRPSAGSASVERGMVLRDRFPTFSVDAAKPPESKRLNEKVARKPASAPVYAGVTGDRLGRANSPDQNPQAGLSLSDSYARSKIRVTLAGESEIAGGLASVTEPEPQGNTEAYDAIADNSFCAVKEQPLSTFSVDVDTASYANVRRFLNGNERPPKGAVRIEELVNYFRYDYPQPEGENPFSCKTEVATCPWQTEHRLVRIGLKGREIKRESRPAANLVFLIDVSGSMQPENRLPLVKKSLSLLVDQLSVEDTVAIAVYAGNSGCVLEPTHDRNKMRAALDRLEAGGSTNGAAGIQLAYDLAQRSFKKGGTNRVILCTDGDFNVGITSQSELISMIQDKAKTGIFLSVFGVGFGNLKDATLEKLADKGNGNYGYIDTLAEGRKVFVEQMMGTLFTIAKDVKVQVEFNPTQAAAYRLIGYEDRLLAKEDFNDDTKDAGEIGAGHTVTALYEVVPAGKPVPDAAPVVDDLKYQKAPKAGVVPVDVAPAGEPPNKELLTVKLRCKQPDGDVSKKYEYPLTDSGATWEKSSRDFRWAASVASFGLLLRDSPHKGSANWNMTLELATEGKGDDRDGYRSEFVGLVEKAKALSR